MHSAQPRVLIYVQHLLGIGHLMRARRIAIALHENNFQVTFVTGGLPVEGFEVPGLNHVALSPIAVKDGDFSALVDSDGNLIDEEFKQQRCKHLLEVYDSVQPDVILLEAFPFGRRQVRFELMPLLDKVDATVPRPVVVSSIRDVLQRRSKPGRDEQTVEVIKQKIDKVLVHGDPAFATLDESFPLSAQIADKIIYTGLVSNATAEKNAPKFDIVVSAGGGAVGINLIKAALEAATLLPDDYTWCIITGPNLPVDDYKELAELVPANVTLEQFRQDFPGLLLHTRLSISQAGYNTVNDILQAGCRSLLIPYSAHGETEQQDRAEQLQRLGLAQVVQDALLSGEFLATAVQQSLSISQAEAVTTFDFNGANRTAEVLLELVRAKQRVDES